MPSTHGRRMQPATIVKAKAAIALRIQGMGYPEIAKEIGYRNPGNAHRIVWAYLEKLNEDTLEDARRLQTIEAKRMEELWSQAYAIALHGPDAETRIKAIGTCVRISESRRKLFGVDAPDRHEHSGPGGGPIPIESEVAQLPGDELDRELALFMAGVEAEQQRALSKPKRARKGKRKKPKQASTKQARGVAPSADRNGASSGDQARGQSIG